MSVERRGPAVCSDSNKTGGKGEMTKAPISLQDLRRSLSRLADAAHRLRRRPHRTTRPRCSDSFFERQRGSEHLMFSFLILEV
jgi:hypothetical protein